MAYVGERKNYKDSISIIRLKDWKLDGHFETETEDFEQMKVSQQGSSKLLFAILHTDFKLRCGFKLHLWFKVTADTDGT